MNNLFFNNKDLYRDLNGFMLSGYEIPTVEQVQEVIDIEGNPLGGLIEKIDSYKDLIFECNVRILTNIIEYPSLIPIIKNWCNNINDDRLYFNDNLEKCMKVKLAKASNFTKVSNYALEFKLYFQCQPFYFDSIEESIMVNSGDKIVSETDIDYEITANITSNGNSSIIVNGQELQFTHTGTCILDCVRGYLYKEDKTPIVTKGNEFLKVKKGENSFSFNNISRFELLLRNRYRG